jgi:Xaa-Pro dipeptidase
MPNQDILDLQPAHIRELQNRYERAMADHGYDSLLIASGAAPYRYRDDQAYVFQGFGPFLHWTGLAGQEHSWLLVRPGQKPVLWLYQPVDFWQPGDG